MILGYARVSTIDQNLDLQMDALKKAGCEKIFSDKMSSAKSSRPELDKMKNMLRAGDKLVIWRLDRLGGTLKDLIVISEFMRENNIDFQSLTEEFDTSTIGGRLYYNIIASMAQARREIIVDNTFAGLAAARSRGRIGGRKEKLSDQEKKYLLHLYEVEKLPVSDICEKLNITKPTLYASVAKPLVLRAFPLAKCTTAVGNERLFEVVSEGKTVATGGTALKAWINARMALKSLAA